MAVRKLPCGRCHRTLPLTAFGPNRARPDRHNRQWWCRECRAAYRREPGECLSCGDPTRSRKSFLCDPCRTRSRQVGSSAVWYDHNGNVHWTRERIIKAIQEFVQERGRLPVADEWGTGRVGRGKNASPGRFGAEARRTWPSEGSIRHVFGTWNAAIKAAGFKPRRSDGRTSPRVSPKGKVSRRCVNGHPWIDPYVWNGKEQCRACRKAAAAKVAARRRRERRRRVPA